MLEMDFLWRENWKSWDKNRNNATMHARNGLLVCENWKRHDENRKCATMHARNELFEVEIGFQNIAHQITIAQYSILR